LLVKHARGLLDDLAQAQRRPVLDFRCTLLVAVLGKAQTLWVQVGDGAIVAEQQVWEAPAHTALQAQAVLTCLGTAQKGEFANQTVFLTEAQPADVQWGLLASDTLTGLALMSDGASEKLVASHRQTVSARVSAWLAALREGRLLRSELTQAFYAPDFCQRSTGDDRSIALVSAPLLPEPATQSPPSRVALPPVPPSSAPARHPPRRGPRKKRPD
jgi:hypothetical protein